jgi:hypothetical protein
MAEEAGGTESTTVVITASAHERAFWCTPGHDAAFVKLNIKTI